MNLNFGTYRFYKTDGDKIEYHLVIICREISFRDSILIHVNDDSWIDELTKKIIFNNGNNGYVEIVLSCEELINENIIIENVKNIITDEFSKYNKLQDIKSKYLGSALAYSVGRESDVNWE